MGSWLRVFAVSALVFLSGCVSRISQNQLQLADAVSYQLQGVPSDWQARSMTQLLTLTRGDETNSLLTQLEIADGELRLVALTPEGMSLFSLVYLRTGEIQVEKYLPLGELYPEYVIADLQLSLWPIELVNQGLKGATLLAVATGRELKQGDTKLVTLSQTDKVTTLINHVRDYSIIIQTIE